MYIYIYIIYIYASLLNNQYFMESIQGVLFVAQIVIHIPWNYPPPRMPVTSRESQPKPSFVTFASSVGARPNINFTCQPVSSSNFMVTLWDDKGHLTLPQPATKFKAVFCCSWETVWLFLFCWAVEFSVVFWSFSCWYRLSYLHSWLDAPTFLKVNTFLQV